MHTWCQTWWVQEEGEAERPIDMVGLGQGQRGAASPLLVLLTQWGYHSKIQRTPAETGGLFPGAGYFLALPSILPYLYHSTTRTCIFL